MHLPSLVALLFITLLIACSADDTLFPDGASLVRIDGQSVALQFNDGNSTAYRYVRDLEVDDVFAYDESVGNFTLARLDEAGNETVTLTAALQLLPQALDADDFLLIDSLDFPLMLIGEVVRFDNVTGNSCSYGDGTVEIVEWDAATLLMRGSYVPMDTTRFCPADGRTLARVELEVAVQAVRLF